MPNGFENFMQGALELGNRWHQERQQARLATALSTYDKDPEGAAVAATRIDPQYGVALTNQVKQNALAQQTADRARQHEALGDLITYLRPAAQDPNATPDTLGKAYDSLTPVMAGALGMKPQEIAQWRNTFISNPGMLDDLAARAKDIQAGAPGTVFFDKRAGRPVYAVPQPDQIMNVPAGDGSHSVVTVPRTYNGQAGPAVAPPAAASAPAATPTGGATPAPGTPEREALYNAIEAQESSHTPGKVGPKTKYGTPIGLMQTLPSTAQAMALKLGMPWRPDLLAGTDNQSAAYQRTLGRAAFDESLERHGGDVHLALQDYYGGPNQKRWGPKTAAYPGQVMSHLDPQLAAQFGGGQPISAVGAGNGFGAPATAGAPAGPAGAHTVFTSAPKPASQTEKGWRPMTPDEITQRGLDPKVQWQVGVGGTHDGEIKIIGPANQMSGKGGANDPATTGARYDAMISDMTRLRDLATTLKAHPGLDRATGWESYFPNIRGGHAADFDAQLRTFRSQIGFGVLQHLREMSKTGGAIGRVSNYEAQLLQDNLGSLDEGQSPESFRANLDKVVNYANEAIGRFGQQKTSAMAPPRQQQPAAPASKPPQAGGGVNPQAVQMLKQNPSALRRQQFDAIFGAGASAQALGGQ